MYKNAKCPFNGHFVFLCIEFFTATQAISEFVSGQNCELTIAGLQLHRIFEVYEIAKCPFNGHFAFLDKLVLGGTLRV